VPFDDVRDPMRPLSFPKCVALGIGVALLTSCGSGTGGNADVRPDNSTSGSAAVDLGVLEVFESDPQDAAQSAEEDFVRVLLEESGAGGVFTDDDFDLFVSAYSDINSEATAASISRTPGASQARRFRPIGNSPQPGGFTGFLEQTGRNFSEFEQLLNSGESGSRTVDFDKKVEIDGQDGVKISVDLSIALTFTLDGSKASIGGDLTGNLRMVSAQGEVLHDLVVEFQADASVNLCPDLDGVSRMQASLTASGVYNGAGVRAELELSSSGSVGNDAYLSGVDWRSRGRLEVVGPGSDYLEVGVSGKAKIEDRGVGLFGDPGSVVVTDFDAAGVALLGKSESVVLVQYIAEEFLTGFAMNFAQSKWRSGFCLEIRTTEESSSVDPGAVVQFTATVWHRFDAREEQHPIRGSLSTEESLVPKDEPQDPPVIYTYTAPDESGKTNTVRLESTSNRGIANKYIEFETGAPGYRIELDEIAKASNLSVSGGVCDLTKNWTTSLVYGANEMTLVFEIVPSTPDGRSGTVSITQMVTGSDFSAVGKSGFSISADSLPSDAPEGSFGFTYGPTELVPLVEGAIPRTIPRVTYLLVPDSDVCEESGP
jgi:hypothetical protein